MRVDFLSPLKPKEDATFDPQRAADEHAKVAESQHRFMAAIAKKLDAGATLNTMERWFAAAVLRAAAEAPIPAARRKRGQAPQIDPGKLAMEYADLHINVGLSRNKAYEKLAERYGKSTTAIKKALNKYGDNAVRLVTYLKKFATITTD